MSRSELTLGTVPPLGQYLHDDSVTELWTLTCLMPLCLRAAENEDEDDDDGLLLSVGEYEPGWRRNV